MPLAALMRYSLKSRPRFLPSVLYEQFFASSSLRAVAMPALLMAKLKAQPIGFLSGSRSLYVESR
jgi:hypothetical protein